jgi:hypothetical protein
MSNPPALGFALARRFRGHQVKDCTTSKMTAPHGDRQSLMSFSLMNNRISLGSPCCYLASFKSCLERTFWMMKAYSESLLKICLMWIHHLTDCSAKVVPYYLNFAGSFH